MFLDLIGRINNTKLSPGNCLSPLFEAIVNSIHAIEDAGLAGGKIQIYITRSPSQSVMESEGSAVALNPIESFIIEDNGVGFDDANFKSFQTSDTTKKAVKGGKGVGRLLWLKAFNKAEIESVYASNGSYWKRTFEFTLSKSGVVHESKTMIESDNRKTTVTLVGFKPEFERRCPKSAQAIARKVVEHCLEYFVLDSCPKIVLHDRAAQDVVDLNRMFASHVKIKSKSETIKVRDKKFRLIHMLVSSGAEDRHRLFFCAHKRTVKSEPLAEKIPNLLPALRLNGEEKSTVYTGYISGAFLDEMVNAERTGFALPEHFDFEFADALTWEQLLHASVSSAAKFLSPYTEPIRHAKEE
jgi:hypothetical protein